MTMDVLCVLAISIAFAQFPGVHGDATTTDIVAIPGGTFVKTIGSDFHGNNISLRSGFLSQGARQSWLDHETELPNGTFTKLFFYIHNIEDTGYRKIRFQIWRPNEFFEFVYSLVWEKIVTIQSNSPFGVLYTITLSDAEQFQCLPGDRIGWTNEDDVGFISCDFFTTYEIYSRQITDNNYPIVDTEYVFDQIPLTSIFSVGVEVKPIISDNDATTTFGNTNQITTSEASGYDVAQSSSGLKSSDTETTTERITARTEEGSSASVDFITSTVAGTSASVDNTTTPVITLAASTVDRPVLASTTVPANNSILSSSTEHSDYNSALIPAVVTVVVVVAIIAVVVIAVVIIRRRRTANRIQHSNAEGAGAEEQIVVPPTFFDKITPSSIRSNLYMKENKTASGIPANQSAADARISALVESGEFEP